MQFASLGQAGTPVTTSALDQAVKSFNSPTLDGPTRASLNDVLTKFTQREDVPSFVGSIFDSQCSPMAKFYGVLALKHFVANFWETMAPDARLQFRGYIWSVMERASMEHQETIRKGMCDAVVGVAKEEYPQVWPSLVEELVRGAQGAPEMVVSCLEIVGAFSDAVSKFAKNSLTSARAAEIVNALTAEMQSVISAIGAALGSGNDVIIDAAMGALKSLVQWIDSRFFFETPILNELCTRFLQNPRFTQSVVMILGEVISMNFIPEEFLDRLPDLFIKIIQAMKAMMSDGELSTEPAIQSFFTSTMPTFMSLYGECVEQPQYAEAVGQLVEWIVQMTEVADEDYFGDAVEYWNELFMRLGGEIYETDSIAMKLYQRFVGPVRHVLMRRIPSPIEVTENQEDDGSRSRKVRTNLGYGDMFRTVKSALGFIHKLDQQGTFTELSAMVEMITSGNGDLRVINAFAWSFGAVLGELNEQTDRTFVANSLALLIETSNKAQDPDAKIQIAGDTCFVCGQANKFLLRDNQIFINVVNWMFDLASVDSPDVQAISIECMKVLAQNNEDQMIKRIVSPEKPSILEQVLGSFAGIASKLPEEAAVSFFEITAQMISCCPGDCMAESKVAMFQVMSDFLGGRMKELLGSFTCEDPQMCHQIVFTLNCFKAISVKLGNIFLTYFLTIFEELLALYNNVTAAIGRICQTQLAPNQPRPNIASLHSVTDGIIHLLDRTIYNTFNTDLVRERLVPVCLTTIIPGFKSACPEARCPRVLSLIGSLALKCPSDVEQNIERIFVDLYHPALDMIKGNFTDYNSMRPEFFYFITSLVRSCIQTILRLPPPEFNTFVESMKWGAKHPQHEVSVPSTMLLGDFVDSACRHLSGDALTAFVSQYGVSLLLSGFDLLTDTSVKFAFHGHVRFIRSLVRCPTMCDHASEIMKLMIEKFSNQDPKMLYSFMQSLFQAANDERTFTSHCQDFLICVKHILRQDPDLKEAQKNQILEEANERFKDLAKPPE